MRIEQLEQAIDRYGGDLARWPDNLRTDAEALIARDTDAAKIVDDAARLEASLADALTPEPIDAALIGRIIAGIDSGAHATGGLRPTPRLAAWAGAAMIAFLSAGYVAGVMLPASEGEDTFAGLMFGSAWLSDTETSDAGSLL